MIPLLVDSVSNTDGVKNSNVSKATAAHFELTSEVIDNGDAFAISY